MTATFEFGDTYKGKASDIGITYNDFVKMRKNEPVSFECVMSCAEYMIPFTNETETIGESIQNYIEQ